MAKDRFEFARIASPEEIAEYLSSLAVGLKRGEISLESGGETLHLSPGPELKLDLKVTQRERKGRIELELGWRRQGGAKAADLHVTAGASPGR
jgi:amphi-Trp domain-containing protein